MKRFLTIALALVVALVAVAAGDTPQERYIKKYASVAVSEMKRSGVPASITLAQGILESRSGLSPLAKDGNNHFGIKCHKTWKGKRQYADDDAKHECFRVYRSADESFRDHSDFLRYNDRYKGLFELKPTDYKGWAKGLKKAGYATDPQYPQKLIKIIEDYKLYKYDGGVVIEEIPETPIEMEKKTVEVAKIQPEYKESYRYTLNRTVYERNGVKFVNAEEGETYESIAEAYNLFPKEILKFNDLSASRPLHPGDAVYIQAKKKYAAKGMEMYVFSGNESLWDVAQRFAVKEKSILKLNGLSADYTPAEGDNILLRK